MNSPLGAFAAILTVLAGVMYVTSAMGTKDQSAWIGYLFGVSCIVCGISFIVLMVST